jgi:hypothetical protein
MLPDTFLEMKMKENEEWQKMMMAAEPNPVYSVMKYKEACSRVLD